MASLRVVLRSGSEADEYVRIDGTVEGMIMGYHDVRIGTVLLNEMTACSRRMALGAALVVESIVLVGVPKDHR